MSYNYFVKCITDECINNEVSPDDIISLDHLGFFNVLIKADIEQVDTLIDHWESEKLNVSVFGNKTNEDDSDQFILMLTTIPCDEATTNLMAEYSKSLTRD